MTVHLADAIARVQRADVLSEDEACEVFATMFSGAATAADIAALLSALYERGETVSEIVGAVKAAQRAQRSAFTAPETAIDTCGTGGDGFGTFNVSTAVALAAASMGVPVVKHGNRANSSKAGSADVLQHLGFALDERDPQARFAQTGFAFLFAPQFHPGFAHVAPVRKALGHRTIFNLLGPLLNPASIQRQVVGVFAERWVEPLAHVLKALGRKRALVVHGGAAGKGTDELTTWGESTLAFVESGVVRIERKADWGLSLPDMAAVAGAGVEENARIVEDVLRGRAHRSAIELVALNLAAALWVAGRGAHPSENLDEALVYLRSGAAGAWLDDVRARS